MKENAKSIIPTKMVRNAVLLREEALRTLDLAKSMEKHKIEKGAKYYRIAPKTLVLR